MRSGTYPVASREIGWLVSDRNVVVWVPNEILLFSSGQMLSGPLADGAPPIGTLMIFPESNRPLAVLARPEVAWAEAPPDEQLARLLREAPQFTEITPDGWQFVRRSGNAPQLMRDAQHMETFAELLPAIKRRSIHGEQPSDIALRTIGQAGAHPMIVRSVAQLGDERILCERRHALASALETIAPERFAGLADARKALLPDDQFALASYWADDLHWLSFEATRQFTQQHPAVSGHLFGAWLLGDPRAKKVALALLDNLSTKKAAALWMKAPQCIGDPPDWIAGASPLPQAVSSGSRRGLLPMLRHVADAMAKDSQQIGQGLAALKACDTPETRANPHLAFIGKTPEGVVAAQNLLLAGVVNPKKTDPAQLRRVLDSLDAGHKKQIGEQDFVGNWKQMRERLADQLTELIFQRLMLAAPDERPAGLFPKRPPKARNRQLALQHRVRGRVRQAVWRQIKSVPIVQGLNMARNRLRFEGDPNDNGQLAQRRQLYNYLLSVVRAEQMFFGQDFDEGYVRDVFHPLLMRRGREETAAELSELGAATELLSADELSGEGEKLNHCVGGYASSCRSGRASIWHLQAPDSRGGSTLEFGVMGNRLVINQHRGRSNCSPTEGEKRLAHALLGSLQRRIRRESPLRERIAIAREANRATVTKPLPDGLGQQIRSTQELDWVMEDPSGAGLLCDEIGVRRGIHLPDQALTCDLDRRMRYAEFAENRMRRDKTAQAMQNAMDAWNLPELFSTYVHATDDRLLVLDLYFEQIRPWLPKTINAPDLLGVVWRHIGMPEEAKALSSEEFHRQSVQRGREWREAKIARMADLDRLAVQQAEEADGDAPGERPPQPREQQLALGAAA